MDLSKIVNQDTIILLTIPALLLFLAVIGGAVFLLVNARKHRLKELEIALKQDLLNRGMSVEDIERVIKATGQAEPCASGPRFPENLDPTTAAKLVMLAHGHDVDEIERLIQPAKSEAKY
jgi:hypothetical protein